MKLKFRVRVRIRVTLQLTVSQSVRHGVEPDLGLLTRDNLFIFFFGKLLSCHLGAPSLTRGRVCHLSVYSQSTVVRQYIHKIFTYTIDNYNIYSVLDTFTIKENKIQYVQYTQASFSPGFAQQIMP
jgi:hypothetical protein